MKPTRGSCRPQERVEPGPGQESVWDYPRPPRIEPVADRIVVRFAGEIVAETTGALRVLETSHPPTYYIPAADVRTSLLAPHPRRTLCEFKGTARYWTLHLKAERAEAAAWSYPRPWPGYEALKDHLAFYADAMQACFVGEERVDAQASGFYGGWITARIVGPFKGAPGTEGW
ncbi:MAG: DUF427 domain-containing protein [Rhodovibrionaceae bacterium]|nr:DUF427 domain-containing protein [Rhodovibrionaceae bacterium]